MGSLTTMIPQFVPLGPVTINLHFAVVILVILLVIGITKLLVPEYDVALFLTAMAAGFTATVMYDMLFGPRFNISTLISTKTPSELERRAEEKMRKKQGDVFPEEDITVVSAETT